MGMGLIRFLRTRLLSAALAAVLPFAATAQDADRATLVSDQLEIAGDSQLIATGNVEVFYQGYRLRASRVVYDQTGDRLVIDGPITMTDASGDTLILASAADLSADMTEGILDSARLVLNQQLQLASSRMMRVAGRYTALDRVVASSCKVCASSPVPLWEIRARRVVHDEVERQLYFDHAQFRVAGVPVFYIPRLRMPDPTLERARGFLSPTIRTTSDLGFGIKVPYFIPIGTSRDLTLAPYITSKGARSVDLRYRQAFSSGWIELNGALSRDDLMPGDTRGYLKAIGYFNLPDSFILSFSGITTTDPAYLLDYGITDADRLDSRIELSRTRRNGFFSARIISFQTLRDTETAATLPSLMTDVTFHRRFSLGPLGGEGGLRLQSHSHLRSSSDPLDGNGDGIADGRDVSRLSARIDWRRSFILPAGIEASLLGEAQADAYTIGQDAIYAGEYTRGHTTAGIELRWPLVKTTTAGATHVIEPVAQLVWSSRSRANIPNEDSTLVEFDENSLFSLDRFPGADAVEKGARLNLGVTWTRYDPDGWSTAVTLGRVLRERDYGQFGTASGLDGRNSDWLLAATAEWQSGLVVTGRMVFDDSFSLSKGEVRLTLGRERLGVSTSALWAEADLTENRPDRTREFRYDARWRMTDAWTLTTSGSYDFEAERGTLAGLGLEFRNECVAVDLSLSRRFTTSTSVTPTTSFDLSVDLIGFGGGKTAGPSRRCY